jgi:repressor LexA
MQINPNPNPDHITPRQMEVLRLVRDYRRSHGFSPTLKELAAELGVSKVTVFEHLSVLQKKGLLKRSKHKVRSLEIADDVAFPDEADLPLVGWIAAGKPIEAIEDRQALALDQLYSSRHERFALRVRGDSMIEDQIRDGDYVIAERRSEVQDGETVVAVLSDGEATLKKIYRESDGAYRLQPANSAYAPLIVPSGKLEVQGVVIGVMRRY